MSHKTALGASGFHIDKTIPFLSFCFPAMLGSTLCILIGLILFFARGFDLGVDFAGGLRMQISLASETTPVDAQQLRGVLERLSTDLEIVRVGDAADSRFFLTFLEEDQLQAEDVTQALEEAFGNGHITIESVERIRSTMGDSFLARSLQIFLLVSALILLYVMIRFNWYYGVGAISALVHDMLILLVVCLVFRINIDVTVIAAFLTVLGYSVNDTIVIFDRIREQSSLFPERDNRNLFDGSITKSLSRTIVTSLTTFFVAFTIFLFAGMSLRAFGLLLSVGVISGTYSSLFIASPISYMLIERKDRVASD